MLAGDFYYIKYNMETKNIIQNIKNPRVKHKKPKQQTILYHLKSR